MAACDTDVADTYGVELMRLYYHYRFRWFTRQAGTKAKPPVLALDDTWTRDYYGRDKLDTLDRLRFAGR